MNPSSIGGLQMLSNAAVEVNNDKDTPKNKTKKDSINSTKKKKKSSYDAWEVFKFQVREEHRINKVFDNIEDFLQHWLIENGCKENGKLKQLYVNKRPHKKTRASITKGLENFQKEVSDRYRQLSFAQKALYRAVGKEYFIKNCG